MVLAFHVRLHEWIQKASFYSQRYSAYKSKNFNLFIFLVFFWVVSLSFRFHDSGSPELGASSICLSTSLSRTLWVVARVWMTCAPGFPVKYDKGCTSEVSFFIIFLSCTRSRLRTTEQKNKGNNTSGCGITRSGRFRLAEIWHQIDFHWSNMQHDNITGQSNPTRWPDWQYTNVVRLLLVLLCILTTDARISRLAKIKNDCRYTKYCG